MGEGQKVLDLVKECLRYGFTTEESLKYIELKLGHPISERHFYRVKKYVESDPAVQFWINQFTRIGFALEHQRRIEEMEEVRKKIERQLAFEFAKDPKDWKVINMLLYHQRETNRRLTELAMGSPTVAQIKAWVDKAIEREKNGEDSERVQGVREAQEGYREQHKSSRKPVF